MHDLAGLAAAVAPSGYLHVLPNAPLGGFGGPEGTVRAWYERGGRESPEAVRLALAGLDSFVREVLVRFRVAAGRALLLGFSQGGALALRYGLPRPDVFAGVASLSGSLRRAEELREGLLAGREQAVFLAHGAEDLLVPVEWGRGVRDLLEGEGYRPVYLEFPAMGHEVGPALFTGLVRWITATLPPGAAG
jgi:phospholipase/carboxylesterase